MRILSYKIDETKPAYGLVFCPTQHSDTNKIIIFTGSTTDSKPTKDIFRELADKWKRETAHQSIISRRLQHPAYRRILNMGPSVAPLILEEMKLQPDHWFHALVLLTGENPVPPDFTGTVSDAAELWIRWGRSRRTITSPIDPNYNCVAWAIGDTLRWWEPFGLILPTAFPPYHWPDDLPHNLLPQTFIKFFEAAGFQVTDDPELESGVEKLALYVRNGEFQHAARQLPNGRWTSKIGPQEDIEHDLDELESDNPIGYGKASIFLKRQK